MRKPTIIDLTQEIYNDMPVYPGHQRTAIFPVKTHAETKIMYGTQHTSATMGVLLSDHGPTHTDAFNHIDASPDAPSIERLPLELFYTDAVCLDVSHVRAGEYITRHVLQEALRRAGLTFPRGGTVLLYTGQYDRAYGSEDWLYHYPGLDHQAMAWLADEGAVNVGIDAPSIDSSVEMKHRNYPAHRVCRERRVLNTENMANLGRVAGKRFTYVGFPLPIRGGTGSPVRAVALLFED